MTFSVLAILVLTLSSLKMSQLKSISCFNSLANHTKSLHCFTFILFVKFMVQPFESFHKTTPMGFHAYLLLSSRLCFPLPFHGGLFSHLRTLATQNILPQCHHRDPQTIPIFQFSIGLSHFHEIRLVYAIFKTSFHLSPTPASGAEVLPSVRHMQQLYCFIALHGDKVCAGSWRRNQCHAPAQVSLALFYLKVNQSQPSSAIWFCSRWHTAHPCLWGDTAAACFLPLF